MSVDKPNEEVTREEPAWDSGDSWIEKEVIYVNGEKMEVHVPIGIKIRDDIWNIIQWWFW